MANIRATLCGRVSITDQNKRPPDPRADRIRPTPWELVDTYQDTISGAKASRPGLERLMQDARSRQFDAVLVYKLDRWAGAEFIALMASKSCNRSASGSLLFLRDWTRITRAPPPRC